MAKEWESAGKLISGGICRKKNLTPGAVYEVVVVVVFVVVVVLG